MSEYEDLQAHMMQTYVEIGQRMEAWATKFMADMQPILQVLAPYLPKQKIVERRTLAARRARRRNERKGNRTR